MNLCFLTFAVPFEETCVVFSNSFVRQIRCIIRHTDHLLFDIVALWSQGC
jgi:hypothetical protein